MARVTCVDDDDASVSVAPVDDDSVIAARVTRVDDDDASVAVVVRVDDDLVVVERVDDDNASVAVVVRVEDEHTTLSFQKRDRERDTLRLL